MKYKNISLVVGDIVFTALSLALSVVSFVLASNFNEAMSASETSSPFLNTLYCFFIITGILFMFFVLVSALFTTSILVLDSKIGLKDKNIQDLEEKAKSFEKEIEEMKKIPCPNCGKRVSQDSGFCDNCGHKLKDKKD